MDEEAFNKIVDEASLAFEKGKWQEAIRLLESCLSPVVKSSLAVTYGNLGQYNKTVELLGPITKELSIEGKNHLATAYLKMNLPKQAARLLESVKEHELILEDKKLLALAYIGLGEDAKIVRLLEPHEGELDADGQRYLAYAYLKVNNPAKAVRLLGALTNDELTVADKTNLAAAYIHLGQFNNVVTVLAEIEQSALPLAGKTNLALAYSMLGRHTAVIELLTPPEEELPFIGKSALAVAHLYENRPEYATNLIDGSPNQAEALVCFMSYILAYLKSTILGKQLAGAKGHEFFKTELVALFYNRYLALNLPKTTLDAEAQSLFNQLCVLALLKLDANSWLSYYCDTASCEAMFKAGQTSAKLRLLAVSALPADAETLLRHNDVAVSATDKLFMARFSLRANNLELLRRYGGPDGQDGLSLRFKARFFDPLLTSLNSLAGTTALALGLPLFRVCYLEPQADASVYKIYGLATPDGTSYLDANPTNNCEAYQTEVVELDRELISSLEPLLASMGKIYLPFLPYLFKDSALADEAECHMISFKATNERALAYEVDVLDHLDGVDLGPNLEEEKKAYWQSYFTRHEIAVNLNTDGALKAK